MRRSRPATIARRRLLQLGSLCLGAWTVGPGWAGAAEPQHPNSPETDPYVLGVFPFLPPSSLDRHFAGITRVLGGAVGRPVTFRTKSDLEAFAVEIARGEYDIAFVNPFEYLDARGYGYLPLARVDEPLTMVLLAPTASAVARMQDLAGKTLALPPEASAVSRLAKLALFEAGLRPGIDLQVQFYQSKSSCVQALAVGNAAACGLPRFALPKLGLSDTNAFKIVHERKLPVGLSFIAHRRLPELDRSRIQAALLGLSETEPGRSVLTGVGWPRLVEATDRDFDDVRVLESKVSTLAMWR